MYQEGLDFFIGDIVLRPIDRMLVNSTPNWTPPALGCIFWRKPLVLDWREWGELLSVNAHKLNRNYFREDAQEDLLSKRALAVRTRHRDIQAISKQSRRLPFKKWTFVRYDPSKDRAHSEETEWRSSRLINGAAKDNAKCVRLDGNKRYVLTFTSYRCSGKIHQFAVTSSAFFILFNFLMLLFKERDFLWDSLSLFPFFLVKSLNLPSEN